MKSQEEVRALVNRVVSYPLKERERIYHKYFASPSQTVRFLCQEYQFDKLQVLDATCHYGYYLVYCGEGSAGLDGSPQYLQFAREMGLDVREANIEEPLPDLDRRFDAVLFSGTLEEILSPHTLLMRFHRLLKPEGLLCLRVPTVPPAWFESIYRRVRRVHTVGYEAQAHIYFFTPRTLQLTVRRAGYDIVQVVAPPLWLQPMLRPFHRWLLPLTPTTTILARPRANFQYPPARALQYLPSWAADLGPFHQK